jgi:lipopolysaccharide biosynthesis protein
MNRDGDLRYIAIHLPQFHPITENDDWWGKGFTEWRNVARARPLFPGHYQPHLPADLGFYDLRLPEARAAQADLARAYGIDGFCYYHYWFHGRRLLERPVNDILRTGQPDFPFCLFWANESWEGRWHGVKDDRRTLVRQEYSPEDDLDHIRWLAQAMDDPRYIRVSGRPLFLVYRPLDLPRPERTIGSWKDEAVRLGLKEPYLLASDSHARGADLTTLGFDGVVHFLPQLGVLDHLRKGRLSRALRRVLTNVRSRVLSSSVYAYDYDRALRRMLANAHPHTHKMIFPGWDNTPRAGRRGIAIVGSSPDKFHKALLHMSHWTLTNLPPDQRILFLNAWNEWAEGNHLEPDLRFGTGYLEAVRRAKLAASVPPSS